jgi:uncharacterized protein YecT (DUF1311 family)
MPNIKHLIGLAVLVGLAFLTTPALAACPGNTQSEMNTCAEADYRAIDGQLTKAYATVKKEVADVPASAAALIKAERAWIAYRDAECAFVAGQYEGGSMQPQQFYGCMYEATKDRIRVLKEDIQQ